MTQKAPLSIQKLRLIYIIYHTIVIVILAGMPFPDEGLNTAVIVVLALFVLVGQPMLIKRSMSSDRKNIHIMSFLFHVLIGIVWVL